MISKATTREKGQTLAEMLLAISVFIVSILGMAFLLTRTLALNKVVTNQYVATYLAAEGLEIVKHRIDANFLVSPPPAGGWLWLTGVGDGWYQVDYDDFSFTWLFGLTFINPNQDLDNVLSNSALFDLFDYLKFNTSPTAPVFYFYSTSPSLQTTSFRRLIRVQAIEINAGENDEARVNSVVVWSTRTGGLSMVNLEDHFFNWRP